MRASTKLDFDSILDDLAQRVTAKLEQRISQLNRATAQRLLNVTQAAQYLGRTKVSVQHLIADGVLPVVRSDKRVFLDIRDLDAWILENKQGKV